MSTWLRISPESEFSIYNLPFGAFAPKNKEPRCATILGDTIIDLSVLEEAGLFHSVQGLNANVFCQPTLNKFLEHERPVWIGVRQKLLELLSQENPNDPTLKNSPQLQAATFYNVSSVTLQLPVQVGDYTDFYASREHATNVGALFREKNNALNPNWLHLPVGYHGRASTVFLGDSNFVVRRPFGQVKNVGADGKEGSMYGACQKLDYELEMAAIIGGSPNEKPMTIEQAKDRIFGFVLMNDWSARDIQMWEYVPLGPFTSKNFATTIAPWIVMAAALEGSSDDKLLSYSFVAPTSAVEQTDPIPLPYLQDPNYSSYDVKLTAALQTPSSSEPMVVGTSNFRNMYWNAAQQLTHHSVTGCIMKAGDMLGSGTISGSAPGSAGCLLEMSRNGAQDIPVGCETRTFLQDGDTVILKGICESNEVRIGFGECIGKVIPNSNDNSVASKEETMAKRSRYHDFVLYGFWRSSSTWRVRVGLAAKSISYKTIPINLDKNEHRSEDFLAKSPSGQVPYLECTDKITGQKLQFSQSLAILHFLDDAFPERHSLIPADPVLKAKCLQIVEVINAGIQPLQSIFYLGKIEELSSGKIKASEMAKQRNEEGMKTIESLVLKHRENIASSAGPFCMGTFSPTIVDACVIPQLYNARRFGVDVENVCPALVKIDAHCRKHVWFERSHPDAQPDAL